MGTITKILRDHQAGHLDWPKTREALVRYPYVMPAPLLPEEDNYEQHVENTMRELELAVYSGLITREQLAAVKDEIRSMKPST